MRNLGEKMIDIHCHILPGIDDGAKTPEDTLLMLKSAIDEGITTIVVSPHHNPEFNNERPIILKKVKEVRDIIRMNQLPIDLLPGQEIRISGEVLADYASGKLITSTDKSHYMLIEFPSNHVPKYASELFYNMILQGLQPILVHPERNLGIIENPQILYNFIKQGVLSQITASSVTGHFGKKVQKLTFDIISNNLTHFVASDAHNITSRSFKMKEAFDIIATKFGFSTVQTFKENAESIITDSIIFPNNPSLFKKKKFFGLF